MKYNSIIFYVSYIDFECYENDIKNDKFILWDIKKIMLYINVLKYVKGDY